MAKDYVQSVADSLVKQMRAGTAPWMKPWTPGERYMPFNPVSGHEYHGMNALVLMGQSDAKGYADRRWLTYRQAEAAGAQVRKGERGTMVQFWKWQGMETVTDASGRPALDAQGKERKELVQYQRPRVFSAVVFNAEQIDGLAPAQERELAPEWQRHEVAEGIMRASGVEIEHREGDRAYYQLSTDKAVVPERRQFATADNYYATVLHELGHSTGHPSRLDRDLSHPLGSEGYAKEELRAEIASLMLGDQLGIGHDPGQHAAYVKSWVKVLQDDPREIFRAAADAEKIVKHVQGWQQQRAREPAVAAALTGSAAPAGDPQVYESELARLLAASTLTPGRYAPSLAVKAGMHAAVFVNDSPVILTGPISDAESVRQADALSRSRVVQGLLAVAGKHGDVRSGAVNGAAIDWQDTAAAVVSKPAGQVEDGRGTGPLVAIVLDDPHLALATNLAINTSTARIFDPDAPELDDGQRLSTLAREKDNDMNQLVGDAAVSEQDPDHVVVVITQVNANEGRDEAPEMVDAIVASPAVRERAAKLLPSAEHDLAELAVIVDSGKTGELEISAQALQRAEADQVERALDVQVLRMLAEGKNADRSFGVVTPISAAKALQLPDTTQQALTLRSQAEVPAAAPQKVLTQAEAGVKKDGVQYLVVPYAEKDQAKEAARGAGFKIEWDKQAKQWYAPAGVDLAPLSKWMPGQAATQAAPSFSSPVDEFAAALREAGLEIEGAPLMDGQLRRVRVDGDRDEQRSGAYVGFLDGHPAGYINNYKSGLSSNWKSQMPVAHVSPEQRQEQQQEKAAVLTDRQQKKLRAQAEAAERSERVLKAASVAPGDHAYLVKKGLEGNPHALKLDQFGNLLLAAQDVDGKVNSLQRISPEGKKLFTKGGRMDGSHALLFGEKRSFGDRDTLIIAEGYATAASVERATRLPVAIAFSAGNILPVAEAYREKFPNLNIIIAGDNDHQKPLQLDANGQPKKNVGKEKSEHAAEVVGGAAMLPPWKAGEDGTDWNDFEKMHGQEATRNALADGMAAALVKIDGYHIKNSEGLAYSQLDKHQQDQVQAMFSASRKFEGHSYTLGKDGNVLSRRNDGGLADKVAQAEGQRLAGEAVVDADRRRVAVARRTGHDGELVAENVRLDQAKAQAPENPQSAQVRAKIDGVRNAAEAEAENQEKQDQKPKRSRGR